MLFRHWEHEPPHATSLALLLSAFTSWEPKSRGPEGPRPGERPIAGVDYQQTGKTFDNLPLTVQAFLSQPQSPQSSSDG